jgi:hypothetical protein
VGVYCRVVNGNQLVQLRGLLTKLSKTGQCEKAGLLAPLKVFFCYAYNLFQLSKVLVNDKRILQDLCILHYQVFGLDITFNIFQCFKCTHYLSWLIFGTVFSYTNQPALVMVKGIILLLLQIEFSNDYTL